MRYEICNVNWQRKRSNATTIDKTDALDAYKVQLLIGKLFS